jgi:hypothetical protein
MNRPVPPVDLLIRSAKEVGGEVPAVRRNLALEDPDEGFTPTPSHPLRITWDDCRESGWFRFCHEEWEEPDPGRWEDPDCGRPGYVSVWVGTFTSERAFSMYLGSEDWWIWDELDKECYELSPFWVDLGLWWINLGYLDDSLWTRYFGDQFPIDSLLRPAPHWERFSGPLLERSRELGILGGNVAVCIYNLDYDGRGVFAFGHLSFVGSFRLAS